MTAAESWLDRLLGSESPGSQGQPGAQDDTTGGTAPFAEMEDTWRQLVVALLTSRKLVRPWVLGVCSAIRGEGRTTNAVGLAAVLATEVSESVLLAECDLGVPSLASVLGTPEYPGVVEVLTGSRTAGEAAHTTRLPNLRVMPAGGDGRYSRIRVGDIPALIDAWRQTASYTLLDMPPVLGRADAQAMLHSLDGVVLVIRAGLSPIRAVGQIVPLVGTRNIVGTIVVGSVPSTLGPAQRRQ